jgi:hypothetical protein
VLPEALEPQAQVQVDGTVDVWVNRGADPAARLSLVRVGSAGTQAAYDAAVRAIVEERLGEVVPPLPLFLRRLLLLAPVGTTLGDLTRDLGGWQPPEIVHRSAPRRLAGPRALVAGAVAAAAHEDGEDPFDLVAVMRGGAIEPISGWDDVELLRTVDALQREGHPGARRRRPRRPHAARLPRRRVRRAAHRGGGPLARRPQPPRSDAHPQRSAVCPAAAVRLSQETERVGAHPARARRGAACPPRAPRRGARACRPGGRGQHARPAGGVATAAGGRCSQPRGVHPRGRARDRTDGGPAVLEPGATLIVETADATVTATIDHVTRHT